METTCPRPSTPPAAILPASPSRNPPPQPIDLDSVSERAVANRTKELEDALREQRLFSHALAHDLGAHIRALAGFSSMALDSLGAGAFDDATQCMSRVNRAASGLAELVEALSRLVHLSSEELHIEPLVMSDIVRDAWEDLHPWLARRNATLCVGELPGLKGDPSLIRLAMVNLLSNATKFSSNRPECRVEVEGMQREGVIEIAVHDNGVGFAPELASRLFEPFVRAHGKHEFPGSGLGLSIVASIVRRHGGDVGAANRRGGGASFFVRLPVDATPR